MPIKQEELRRYAREGQEEQQTANDCDWVSLGGANVCVDDDGDILMGCPGLEGENIDDLGGNWEERAQRQEEAEAAGWESNRVKDAREAHEHAETQSDADVVLVQSGDDVHAFGDDAAHLQDASQTGDGEKAEFDAENLPHHLEELHREGHHVSIAEKNEDNTTDDPTHHAPQGSVGHLIETLKGTQDFRTSGQVRTDKLHDGYAQRVYDDLQSKMNRDDGHGEVFDMSDELGPGAIGYHAEGHGTFVMVPPSFQGDGFEVRMIGPQTTQSDNFDQASFEESDQTGPIDDSFDPSSWDTGETEDPPEVNETAPVEQTKGQRLPTSRRLRDEIEAAVGNDPEDMERFRELVEEAYQYKTGPIVDRNEAVRQLLGQFMGNRANDAGETHGGLARGRFTAALRRAEDPSQIPGFDEIVEHAQQHHPQVFSTSQFSRGNPEQQVFEELKRGIVPIPQRHDDEIIGEALTWLGDMHSDVVEEGQYEHDPSIPDYFHRADVWIKKRYSRRHRFARLAEYCRRYGKQRSLFDDDDTKWITVGGHSEGGKKHAGGHAVQIKSETGEITKGPKALVGKTVDQIDKDVAGTERDKRKENVPPKKQTSLVDFHSEAAPIDPKAGRGKQGSLFDDLYRDPANFQEPRPDAGTGESSDLFEVDEPAKTYDEKKSIQDLAEWIDRNPRKASDLRESTGHRHEFAVAANLAHMESQANDWTAIPISGMSETTNDKDQQVSVPDFAFPKGYKDAPTLYKGKCCGWCGTPIKNVFWAQNDNEKWTLPVGSECITHFMEGTSGEDLAKEYVDRANRDLVQQVHDRINGYIQRYAPDGSTPADAWRQMDDKDQRKNLWSMSKAVGYNQLGEQTSKYLDPEGATNRKVSDWVRKNGESIRDHLALADEHLGIDDVRDEALDEAVESESRGTDIDLTLGLGRAPMNEIDRAMGAPAMSKLDSHPDDASAEELHEFARHQLATFPGGGRARVEHANDHGLPVDYETSKETLQRPDGSVEIEFPKNIRLRDDVDEETLREYANSRLQSEIESNRELDQMQGDRGGWMSGHVRSVQEAIAAGQDVDQEIIDAMPDGALDEASIEAARKRVEKRATKKAGQLEANKDILDHADIDRMTVPEIKDELRKRGLSTWGRTRKQWADRLKEGMAYESESEADHAAAPLFSVADQTFDGPEYQPLNRFTLPGHDLDPYTSLQEFADADLSHIPTDDLQEIVDSGYKSTLDPAVRQILEDKVKLRREYETESKRRNIRSRVEVRDHNGMWRSFGDWQSKVTDLNHSAKAAESGYGEWRIVHGTGDEIASSEHLPEGDVNLGLIGRDWEKKQARKWIDNEMGVAEGDSDRWAWVAQQNEADMPDYVLNHFGGAMMPKDTFKGEERRRRRDATGSPEQPKERTGDLFDVGRNDSPGQELLFDTDASAPKDPDAEAVSKMAPGFKRAQEAEAAARDSQMDRLTEQREWNEQHIKVAADDIESLRKTDVYRVMEWAPEERRGALGSWIQKRRPDLAQEVNEVENDLLETSGGVEKSTAGSQAAEPLSSDDYNNLREELAGEYMAQGDGMIGWPRARALADTALGKYTAEDHRRMLDRGVGEVFDSQPPTRGPHLLEGKKVRVSAPHRKEPIYGTVAGEEISPAGTMALRVKHPDGTESYQSHDTAEPIEDYIEYRESKGKDVHPADRHFAAHGQPIADLGEYSDAVKDAGNEINLSPELVAGYPQEIMDGWDSGKSPSDLANELNEAWQKEAEAMNLGGDDVAQSGAQSPAQVEAFDPEQHGGYKPLLALAKKIDAGELTLDEFKAEHARYHAAKDEHTADLKKRFNAKQLTNIAGNMGNWNARSDNKSTNADFVYRKLMENAFDVGDGYNRTFSMSEAGDPNRPRQRLAEHVGSQTEESFQSHIESSAERSKERQDRDEAHQKALDNPETLDEYRTFVKNKGFMALPDDKRRHFDQLAADETRETRKAQEQETKGTVTQISDTVGGFDLSKNYHSKRGVDIFTASPKNRVSTEDYRDMNAKAKQLGGWYYKAFRGTPGGFHFPDEDSRAKFVSLLEGDIDRSADLAAEKEERAQSVSDRLVALAETMEQKANESLGATRRENTARQAGMAESARSQARADLARGQTMRNIASALADGSAKYLDGVSAGTHLSTLDSVLNRARWNKVDHVRDTKYGGDRRAMPHSEHEAMLDAPVSVDLADHAKYPYPTIDASSLRDAFTALKGKRGIRHDVNHLKAAVGSKEWLNIDNEALWDSFKNVSSKLKSVDAKQHKWLIERLDGQATNFKRLQKMGITNEHELRQALREYVPIRGKSKTEDPIHKAERALRGKQIEGFFPTPPSLVENMLAAAGIQEGHKVLEPSAGKGDLMDAIANHQPDADLTGIEYNRTFGDVLTAKGHNFEVGDFLDHTGQYDRIVMNPPFEKRQDIDHVRHAYEQLSPGGRLVAIVGSGSMNSDAREKKVSGFVEWLDELGADYHENDPGSFAGNDAFRKTNVNTHTIVIDKD